MQSTLSSYPMPSSCFFSISETADELLKVLKRVGPMDAVNVEMILELS